MKTLNKHFVQSLWSKKRGGGTNAQLGYLGSMGNRLGWIRAQEHKQMKTTRLRSQSSTEGSLSMQVAALTSREPEGPQAGTAPRR